MSINFQVNSQNISQIAMSARIPGFLGRFGPDRVQVEFDWSSIGAIDVSCISCQNRLSVEWG
ncbi:hypothetical protein [Microcoleus sp. B5-D4]|uniref:hypothetical protein n=1 Tax=Microcoleus sp. B5-D4 TaxID=2818681 RepID=UPI002FD3D3C2